MITSRGNYPQHSMEADFQGRFYLCESVKPMSSSTKKYLFFPLWIVSTTIWFISFFFLLLLMDFQLVMWVLEQSEWLSRIVLWLRPLIWLIIALMPPLLSLCLYRKHGAFWVITTLVLGVVLLGFSFVFGRIDTQGTISNSLPQAIIQGDIKRARTLVLTVADRYGSSKDVQSLIRAGIDVNARDDWGQTALISVARWGKGRPQPELVKTLIQTGVDVNAKEDLVGDTALISLARWGEGRQISPEVVKILIQAGVDVNVKDNYGHDALFYAAKASNAAEIKALLQPEVDQKVKTNTNFM